MCVPCSSNIFLMFLFKFYNFIISSQSQIDNCVILADLTENTHTYISWIVYFRMIKRRCANAYIACEERCLICVNVVWGVRYASCSECLCLFWTTYHEWGNPEYALHKVNRNSDIKLNTKKLGQQKSLVQRNYIC